MAFLVAVPTVVIDTQVRIVFLRGQSVQTTLFSTAVMATAEISARVAKAALIHRQIQRQRRQMAVGSVSDPQPFEIWRAQRLRYQSTELCVDTYAEYLSIGCSSAITVILGDHPQFRLLLLASSSSSSSSTTTTISSMAPLTTTFHVQLLAQAAVEVVVDYLSCRVELALGLSLEHTNRERMYFLVFFVGLVVANVNTSAILYLAY